MSFVRQIFSFVSGNLRVKVTIGIVFPLVLILGAFTAIEYARYQKAVFTNLSFLTSEIGQVIENGLQHEMLTQNPQGLQHMLDAIGQDQTIRVVYLLDTSGRVVFAPERTGVDMQLDNRDSTCQPCHRLPAAERPGSVVVPLPGGQRVFRSMNPIENQPACQACHNPGQRLIGLLLTDISMAPLEEPLKAGLRENLLWWAGTILVTVLIANLAMSRLVVSRLERVMHTLERFGRGQLDLRLPAEGSDQIGQLAAAFNEMGQRIQSEGVKNRELSDDLRRQAVQRQDLLKRLITAQEEERRRLARDLHDDLGQELAGLAVRLEATERMLTDHPDQARAQLRRARVLISETTDRAYAMIMALRPSALDDLGLAAALRAHAERTLKDTGIQFELETRELTCRMPPEIETALFRTFQEALSNVMRHSGARRVSVSLAEREGSFEGEVADDGRGFDLHEVQVFSHGPRGLGLLGIQERIAQCGGTMKILSRPGAGTLLRIQIPLPEGTHG